MFEELINALNPDMSELRSLFKGFGLMPPGLLKSILATVDERMLQKLAQWSQTFMRGVNELPDVPYEDLHVEGLSDDFKQVMQQTNYAGHKLDPAILDKASAEITLAIKSNNWTQAIWVGVCLGRVAGV